MFLSVTQFVDIQKVLPIYKNFVGRIQRNHTSLSVKFSVDSLIKINFDYKINMLTSNNSSTASKFIVLRVICKT